MNMFVSYKEPTGDANLPVPNLRNATVAMAEQDCVGAYTFYEAQFTVPGDLAYASRIDVISGSGTSALRDDFNSAGELGGSCQAFQNPPAPSLCTTGGAQTPRTVSSSSTSSSTISSPSSSISVSTRSTTSSSTRSVDTPSHRQTVEGYELVGCQKEASNGRALRGASFAYDGMTLESCMGNCTGFRYWGTEYGRECELRGIGEKGGLW